MEEKQTKLTDVELVALRDNAKRTLEGLVTSRGIYASTDEGWIGPYYGWFGRDSAITTDLICAAMDFGGDIALADKARQGLAALSVWQGKNNNVETGEERGKMPHEIRETFTAIDKVQHAPGTNEKSWFVDSKDGVLKNWDSADSTSLWVIVTVRAHRTLNLSYSPEVRASLKAALEWLVDTIKKYDGLVGFLGADLQEGRIYSGLHNQGWKDSFQVYQDKEGLAAHPIKDVLVNAEAWAALCLGYDEFAETDVDFARELAWTAGSLKTRFNDKKYGFLLPDASYFAQAIDGKNKQLPQMAADVAMSLWAFYEDDCVIDIPHIDWVVERVTRPAMFNPTAGVRNYAEGTVFHQGTRYHGSSHTYWPFVSALIARGLHHFSYQHEAIKVVEAYLLAIHQLGSNIEMFIETSDHRLSPWHHPNVGQQGAVEQAWTAAAVYYGSLYLLSSRGSS